MAWHEDRKKDLQVHTYAGGQSAYPWHITCTYDGLELSTSYAGVAIPPLNTR